MSEGSCPCIVYAHSNTKAAKNGIAVPIPLLFARGQPQELFRPFYVEQRVLGVQTKQDGFRNPWKRDVEGISFRVDFVATMYANALPQDLQDPHVLDLAPEPLPAHASPA